MAEAALAAFALMGEENYLATFLRPTAGSTAK